MESARRDADAHAEEAKRLIDVEYAEARLRAEAEAKSKKKKVDNEAAEVRKAAAAAAEVRKYACPMPYMVVYLLINYLIWTGEAPCPSRGGGSSSDRPCCYRGNNPYMVITAS